VQIHRVILSGCPIVAGFPFRSWNSLDTKNGFFRNI
jgi:hypothetical protein